MKNFKKIIFIILLSLILTSCKEEIKKVDIQEINRDELSSLSPKPGGEISIPVINFSTLNPFYPSNSSIYYLNHLIYDSLFVYTEDGEIETNLVEHYNLSPDKKLLSITLKDNVLWHDGSKLTSEDVVFSFETIINSEDSPYKNIFKMAAGLNMYDDLSSIVKFEIFDERNLDIYFQREYANYLDMLTFPIVSKRHYNYELEKPEDFIPVGSGPFILDEIKPDNQIILIKNESYHDRLPYIDKIIVKTFDNYDLAYLAFDTGDINILPVNEYDWSKHGNNSKIKFEEYMTNELDMLYLNNRKSKFQGEDGKIIKQAILRGINKKRIIDRVYLGKATEVSAPLNIKTMAKYGLKSDVYYNKDQSIELLNSIGYQNFNDQGLLVNDAGESINIGIKSNFLDNYKKVAVEFIIEDLRGIGINAYHEDYKNDKKLISSQERIEYENRLIENLKNGDFDLALMSINLTDTPNMGYILHTEAINSGVNYSYYSNSDLDNLLELLKLNLDEEKTKENYLKVLDILSNDVPIMPLYIKESAVIVDEKIQGPLRPIQSDIYRSFRNIFILKQFQ